MIRKFLCCVTVAASLTATAVQSQAAVFHSQDFNDGTNGWRFATATTLDAVGSGGPDGSAYVSRTFDPGSGAPIIFRAQEEFAGIDSSYVGNWITSGVYQVSAYVRHNAPEPLQFNVRMSNPANFPGASYYSPLVTPFVPANVWTKVTFDVTATSPQNVTYEGTDYATVFSNVGHIQFGANLPTALFEGTASYTFDLDSVEVLAVPEPASVGLAAVACSGLALVVRRRRR